MNHQTMLLAFVLGLTATLLAMPLKAENFSLPKESGALITVRSPDGWISELDEGMLTLEEPEKRALVFGMVWEAGSDQKALEGAREVIARVASKIKYTDPRPVRTNGIEGLEQKATAVIKDDGTPLDIRAVILKLPGTQHGLVLALVNANADKWVVERVTSIFQSVTPASSRKVDRSEPVATVTTTPFSRPASGIPFDSFAALIQTARQNASSSETQAAGGRGEDDSKDAAPISAEKVVTGKPDTALEPGRWQVVTEMNDVIYASFLITTATLRLDTDPDPFVLGDQLGMVGAKITAPRDNCPVEVEISSPDYIQVSRFVGILPKAGETYGVWPVLKYDYGKLLSLHQTVPETLTVKVVLDGKPAGEESLRMQIRPINEVLFGFEDEDGFTDMSWTFAAFVNENHPFIDEILREALNLGIVSSFAGYQKDPKGVRDEIKAIWQALKKRGFRYSNITTTSSGEDNVYTQHVRLMGEALKTAQANCVDGSVLLASILRKLGLRVYLVGVPGHMFLAVDLDEEGEERIGIETTMLDDSTLAEAIKEGNDQIKEAGDKFEDPEKIDYQMIDIDSARRMGVIPIRDMRSDYTSRQTR